MDAYFSERRNARAAQTFFERAIEETGVRPERVTTDQIVEQLLKHVTVPKSGM